MSAATDHARPGGRAVALLVLAVVLLLALLFMAPPARGEEAAAPRSCCHKASSEEAALPAGMTDLADDHAQHAAAPAASAQAPSAAAVVTLAAADLLDQDGRASRFPQEVLGDRIVVMDFVFTTCTTICPILSARLASLQARLGVRAGREVGLVSISIDPARDTPARLTAFAARFQAGPGWRWYTGEVAEVERVLKGLGAYSPAITAHAPMMLVGDGRTGRFLRLNGFPETDRLLAAIDELQRARGTVAATGASR